MHTGRSAKCICSSSVASALVLGVTLVCLGAVRAQQVEMLGFAPSGDVVWTNTQPGVFNSLYFAWDLDGQWFPVWWNRQATTDVDFGKSHLSFEPGELGLTPDVTGRQFDLSHAYYRITSTTSTVSTSSIVVANYLDFVNATTSVVSNLNVDVFWGHIGVTSLAPGARSPTEPLSAPFQWAWDCRYTDRLVIDDETRVFFQGNYRQGGTDKALRFPFLFFSLPGYSTTVTIDDDSYAVRYRDLASAVAEVREQLQLIASAIDQLVADTGRWPNGDNASNYNSGVEAWDLTVDKAGLLGATSTYVGWNGPYLTEIPRDPWGQPYCFDPDYVIGVDTNGQPIRVIVVASFGPNRVGRNVYDADDIILILR